MGVMLCGFKWILFIYLFFNDLGKSLQGVGSHPPSAPRSRVQDSSTLPGSSRPSELPFPSKANVWKYNTTFKPSALL